MLVPSVPEYGHAPNLFTEVANGLFIRIVEEELDSSIESRNEALQTIRELGPPDLIHLVRQAKSGGRQVSDLHLVSVGTLFLIHDFQFGVYHHVTGVDASSSASLAAYVNTLVYTPQDKTHKVVSGLYW